MLQRCYLALTIILILSVVIAPVSLLQKGVLMSVSLLSMVFLWVSWRRMGEVAALSFEDGALLLRLHGDQRIVVLPCGQGLVAAWWVVFSCRDARSHGVLSRWLGVSTRHFVVLPDAMPDADDFRAFRMAVRAWIAAQSEQASSHA